MMRSWARIPPSALRPTKNSRPAWYVVSERVASTDASHSEKRNDSSIRGALSLAAPEGLVLMGVPYCEPSEVCNFSGSCLVARGSTPRQAPCERPRHRPHSRQVQAWTCARLLVGLSREGKRPSAGQIAD